MRRWAKQERTAVEAVARHVHGTWEDGEGAAAGFLTASGDRIAVSVATVKSRIGDRSSPRLRFDRVVLSLAARLKAALHDVVPDGSTVLITVTAPIRQPAATAEALEVGARVLIGRRSLRRDAAATIHGNETRIRVVKGALAGPARVAAFVHNPDDGAADTVLETAQALVEGLAAGGAADDATGKRWLVLATEDAPRHAKLYRQILTELTLGDGLEKTVIAMAGGRIEVLARQIAQAPAFERTIR